MVAMKNPPELSGFVRDFGRLCDEMVDYFKFRTFRDGGLFERPVGPEVAVRENANGYTVSCELPGLSRNDVAVSIAGNVLVIRGGKSGEKTVRSGAGLRTMSRRDSFVRSLPLPLSVDVLQSWAELKNGVLIVMLPKRVGKRYTCRQP